MLVCSSSFHSYGELQGCKAEQRSSLNLIGSSMNQPEKTQRQRSTGFLQTANGSLLQEQEGVVGTSTASTHLYIELNVP